MRYFLQKNKSYGFTILEIVLGIAMITAFLVSNSYYYKKVLDVSEETTHSIQSGFLLEEGVEAVKLLRNESWSTNIDPLVAGTPYYLHWTGAAWVLTTTPEQVETVFTRTLKFENVNRDGSDDIVTSGGALDAGTKKVVVDVSWSSKGNRATSTKSVEAYVMNLFDN